ncbi:MAG: fused MFS/spermidine synthase [Pseudomonadota bacterium]
MRAPSQWILLFVVFVEGFAVLAGELMAIRQIIPYTGSGTDTISIIIAAVLLPLAIGNFVGGRFDAKQSRFFKSVRAKLIFNILIAMGFFATGLSYVVIQGFFETLAFQGITNRHVLCFLYAATFLIIPVYLLGQTLPLISHYFRRDTTQTATGKILFFSTSGSFMGSVFCTMVLMAMIGVHYTVVVLIICLAVLIFILSKKAFAIAPALSVIIALLTLGFNNDSVMAKHYVVKNNEYHSIQLVPQTADGSIVTMKLNGNISARYAEDDKNHLRYQDYINKVFFDPISVRSDDPKEVLVIGAGGFVIGLKDRFSTITYIDIDEDLLKVSEEQFLKQKLTKNKTFVPMPARAFLTQAIQNGQQYDMIIIDVFQGHTSLPEHLATREFYSQVYDALKPGGIMAGNFFLSPHFSDALSRRIDNTIHSVFDNVGRHVLSLYDGWLENPHAYRNIIYSAYKLDEDERVYTDNLNPAFYDKNRKAK